MGINPINFEGCAVSGLYQETSGCDSIWPRFAWQTSANASREDLAIQLVDAEKMIGRFALGFNVAPEWMEVEMPYPKGGAGQSGTMFNRYNLYRTVALQQGKIIAGGRRATRFLGTFPVEYKDDDGDEFKETARLWFDNEYDWREVKVYHKGTNANPKWEIRPASKVDEKELNMSFDSWLFVDPDKVSAFPADNQPVVNITDGTNLVKEVDVYLEYNDEYVPSCQFIWNKSSGNYYQDGYLDIVDSEAGIVRPVPAVFDYGIECSVDRVSFCHSGVPDRIKIYYYAGNISDEYRRGYTLDPLESTISESIRLLATARLDRDLCGCTNIIALGQSLRKDMALVSPQGNFLAVADAIQECPFGTRRGEWLAWNRLKTYTDKFHSVALI
jgi:hypothetical protein